MNQTELRRWFAISTLALLLSVIFVPLVAQSRPSPDDLCYARMRAAGLAVSMYLQDYDEHFPLAFGRTPTGVWLWNSYHRVPYDWDPKRPEWRDAYASMWANSVAIYLRPSSSTMTATGYDGLRCPVIRPKRLSDIDYANAQRRPVTVTYTYNGLLHQYTLAQMDSPHIVPVLWEGQGRSAFYGLAISNPVLNCSDHTRPCRYLPRDPNTGGCPSRGVMFAPQGSLWIHPKGVLFAYADGHADWRRLGQVIGTATNPDNDPWTIYNDRGIPGEYWQDGCHPSFFRPNRTQ